MKKRIQELENALADVLAVIPQSETFYGVGENYLETVAEARKVLEKPKPKKKNRFAAIVIGRNGKETREAFFRSREDAAEYTRRTFGIIAIEEIDVGIIWRKNELNVK